MESSLTLFISSTSLIISNEKQALAFLDDIKRNPHLLSLVTFIFICHVPSLNLNLALSTNLSVPVGIRWMSSKIAMNLNDSLGIFVLLIMMERECNVIEVVKSFNLFASRSLKW